MIRHGAYWELRKKKTHILVILSRPYTKIDSKKGYGVLFYCHQQIFDRHVRAALHLSEIL